MFDWITGFVEETGVLGVALLMFAENVFPPIPSELIMPLAGFSAAKGEFNLFAVIAAGTFGSLAGAWFWYGVGKIVGEERVRWFASRHGRWLTLSPKEVDRAYRWFHDRGGWAVFLGRLVPGVRTLISVPAGVADMPLLSFTAYTAAGSLIWTTFLVMAGYVLQSEYDRVADWIDPLSYVVVGLLVVWYVWRVVTFDGETESEPAKRPAKKAKRTPVRGGKGRSKRKPSRSAASRRSPIRLEKSDAVADR